MFPILPPSLLTAAIVVAARYWTGNDMFSLSFTEGDLKSADDGLKNVDMDELVKKLIEEIKRQSPEVVKAIENTAKEETVLDSADSPYLHQIAAAQEFLNENHNADLSHIQRLLQKMMPERYYSAIARLKEHQDPAIIYNIYGGQHLHAPNAKSAVQNWEKK